VALAAAATRLMKNGIILVNANAIETLNRVTAFVFDKTGTLTTGKLAITGITQLSSKSSDECMAIAKALETNSSHPLAKAFMHSPSPDPIKPAEQLKNYPGAGVSAELDNQQYFLGNERFIEEHTGLQLATDSTGLQTTTDSTFVILADKQEIHCLFALQDRIRDGAGELVSFIKSKSRTTEVSSGDNYQSTSKLAEKLMLDTVLASQTPDQKMAHIRDMQEAGEIVAMVGDGVNDAPVLASANVSIAMGDGTALANANADLILLNGRLDKLIDVIEVAGFARNIIRQNMLWAISYNLLALPLAMAGVITPWMAAIGMSLSSLIVVINSNRLNKS
jgi:Cu2+-exporting ATPase